MSMSGLFLLLQKQHRKLPNSEVCLVFRFTFLADFESEAQM